ncbi:MAG: TlpA family protein disulfide reductase [Actinomycetota bacterium]
MAREINRGSSYGCGMTSHRFRDVLVVLVSAIAVGCSSGPSDAPGSNDPAPDSGAEIEFQVDTFDGSTFALSQHRGTPVVINFWESW